MDDRNEMPLWGVFSAVVERRAAAFRGQHRFARQLANKIDARRIPILGSVEVNVGHVETAVLQQRKNPFPKNLLDLRPLHLGAGQHSLRRGAPLLADGKVGAPERHESHVEIEGRRVPPSTKMMSGSAAFAASCAALT